MTEHPKKQQRKRMPIFIAIWVVGIAFGSYLMLNHEFESGVIPESPAVMPAFVRELAGNEKPLTLVMAVHPGCPCSRASIEQLDHFMVRNSQDTQVLAVFHQSEDHDNASPIEEGEYWKDVNQLPNTTAIVDHDHKISRALGATVSGTVVAYDEFNQLRFQGGLTASRGHSGSSIGMDRLEAIARELAPLEICETPAFGCALENKPKSQRSPK